MTPEQIQLLLDLQFRQTLALEKIAGVLEQLNSKEAPNYEYPLESFRDFDWSSIGAQVIRKDQFGAAIVSWNGKQFVRRSPSNKFAAALWFSKCIGKDEDGSNKYQRLITFKSLNNKEVEPVSEKVRNYF